VGEGNGWNMAGAITGHGSGSVFTLCIGALGTPPAERGPSLENIYRVYLTVDLCESNK